jgi:hypothetical protein
MNVTYDSRNRVVSRTSPTGTLNLTYSGWNLIEERNASGTLEQTYVHGAGVDELLVKISSSGPAYYHHDGLGSTVALTGENGELLESYRYDAFGAATILSPSTHDPRPSTAFGNRFLFTGREWLGQAVIYDYRNRVYSSSLGRFLQTDPIRFSAGDVNIYRYVGNGPVNWVDPLGLYSAYDFLDDASNFSAGAGDAISFGITGAIRNSLPGIYGDNGGVDRCSGAYGAGEWTGTGIAAATGVAGGIRAAVVRAARTAGTGAESALNGLRLNKSLASTAQMGEAGEVMAGVGARVPFRDAGRVAQQYGGNAADWVKKTSSSYAARDGVQFETHWVENIVTGQRVEFKTKFP